MYAYVVSSCISTCKHFIVSTKSKEKYKNMEMLKYSLFSLLRTAIFFFQPLSLDLVLNRRTMLARALYETYTILIVKKIQLIYWLILWILAKSLIKPFFYIIKKSGQKCKYFKKEKSFLTLFRMGLFVAILMMSAKLDTLSLLEIKVIASQFLYMTSLTNFIMRLKLYCWCGYETKVW